MIKSFKLYIFIIICLFLNLPLAFSNGLETGEWQISSNEKFVYDLEKNTYTIQNNVVIKNNEYELKSDFVYFDKENMQINAKGGVFLKHKDFWINAKEIDFNLQSKEFTMDDATINFLDNYYLYGKRMHKSKDNLFELETMHIYACDPNNPDWEITGENLKLRLDSNAYFKNALIKIEGIPVFYSPYFFFPTKTKRTTGFLIPYFNYSRKSGFSIEENLFTAINDSSDMTFGRSYITKKNAKHLIEYRYALNSKSKGFITFDFLDDDRYWQKEYNSSAQKRYWFRSKIDQELPYDFLAKIDLDIVSDKDFLYDFKDFYLGHVDFTDYTKRVFTRTSNASNDFYRQNNIIISKNAENYNINFGAIINDDLLDDDDETPDTTVQNMPFLNFSSLNQNIFNSKLCFNFNSNYNYFYRKDESAEYPSAHRMHILSKVYYPINYNFLSLEPSFAFGKTYWNFDEYVKNKTRDTYQFSVNFYTDIFKEYNKYTHFIIPELTYNRNFVYDEDRNFQSFDYLDDAVGEHYVTYAMSNIIKKENKEFFYFKLLQSCTFSNSKSSYFGGRNVSPISGEIEFIPSSIFSFNYDFEWSPHKNMLNAEKFIAKFKKENNEFNVEYNFSRIEKETDDNDNDNNNEEDKNSKDRLLGTSFKYLMYNNNIFLSYNVRYDMQESSIVKSSTSITYIKKCINYIVSYSEEKIGDELDIRWSFNIKLYNLMNF